MKRLALISGALLTFTVSIGAQNSEIVKSSAYRWSGDTIYQDDFFATSPNGTEIISTYSAQPGYFMPVEKTWKLKNDISQYPQLRTPNKLHTAIYNMGLDEMVNAIEPDTTLRTGKEWAGVWTRDVSYSILLSMAYMQPEASKISLMKKVSPTGRIIQDTGSGGAWPISSDRMIWALAAYELYKVTGDKEWLEYIYPIIRDSFADDFLTTADRGTGLVKGETSFIDWREQSYPKWMQTADIYQSEALNTSIVHAQALRTLAEIASELGKKKEAKEYEEAAQKIVSAVNERLWMDDKGYYAMYEYGRDFPILNPRAETLGEALAIIYDVAPVEKAKLITESAPVTAYGAPIFFPQIADMPSYHNNGYWPWVGAMWALANAKAGNEEGTLQAIGALYRPAALFATNKENLTLDNGDIATELNSSNMLWSLAGNIALTHKILFGIRFEKDGLAFAPFVPKALGADRSLEGFRYRNSVLDITVKGYGDKIKSFTLNGKEHKPFIPANIKGRNTIVITMADNDIAPLKFAEVANVKAPLTPITRINGSELSWQPIEYIGEYIVLRDGERIARTRSTTFDASEPGEYQVIGVSAEGVESFASEPLSTRPMLTFDFPDETTEAVSDEISYAPTGQISGFRGEGFVEVAHDTVPLKLTANVPASGVYSLSLRYANGNGPVNTENKCAIRTVSVNGQRAGIVVMPHRGVANWDDWGASNSVRVHLTKGDNEIEISYRPENENMNVHTNHALIDCVNLTLLKND